VKYGRMSRCYGASALVTATAASTSAMMVNDAMCDTTRRVPRPKVSKRAFFGACRVAQVSVTLQAVDSLFAYPIEEHPQHVQTEASRLEMRSLYSVYTHAAFFDTTSHKT